MHLTTTFALLSAGLCVLASCASEYHPKMTHSELAASERYIEGVENKARQHEYEDQMATAEAEEMSTRHAPTHVTRNSTTIVPFFW